MSDALDGSPISGSLLQKDRDRRVENKNGAICLVRSVGGIDKCINVINMVLFAKNESTETSS